MQMAKRFRIARSKPGMGFGLFARTPIDRGTFVVEYTGRKISTAYADTLPTRYLFEIDKDWTIDGSSRTNIARYINHSCEPNCEADIHDDHILISALRDIDAGEELTLDYGKEYFDEFLGPARCLCRKCSRAAYEKPSR
jgi:SET domain-containing protein